MRERIKTIQNRVQLQPKYLEVTKKKQTKEICWNLDSSEKQSLRARGNMDFMEKIMKTLRVKLTAEGKCLAEAKIQRGILQGYALSPLIFITAMMLLNHILKNCTAG